MKTETRYEQLLRRTYVDFMQTSEVIKAPLIFERAEGLYLWDIEGKRYFDAIGGIYVAVLGHRHPRVMAAMHRQMDRMTFAPPLHGVSDVTLEAEAKQKAAEVLAEGEGGAVRVACLVSRYIPRGFSGGAQRPGG